MKTKKSNGKNGNGLTKVPAAYVAVFLADSHLEPGKLPAAHRLAIEITKDLYKQYGKDFHVVIGGDWVEMASFSHWDKRSPLILEGKRYNKEIGVGRSALEDLRAACPDSELVFIEGNHEDRVRRWTNEHAAIAGTIDVRKDLGIDELGIKWIEYQQVYKLGKLSYTHGYYTVQAHAKKTLSTYGDSIIYAHCHSYQVFIQCLKSKRLPHVGMSVGCLGSVLPDWQRRKPPNSWSNGFAIIEYQANGEFQANQININVTGCKASCLYGGQLYTI